RLPRFWMREMTKWPRTDAVLILTMEILLMTAFLTMNAADHVMQALGSEHYVKAGAFPVSSWLMAVFGTISGASIVLVERVCWWFHIIGILAFMNYLIVSKHLHILLA